MNDSEILFRVMETERNLKTKLFLQDLKSKLEKYGSLKGGQRTALIRIASNQGINMITGATTVVRESAPAVIEEIKGSCGDCHDGLVLALQNISKNLYSFRCECSVGEKRQENYPIWRHYHAKEYSIDRPSL